MPAFHHELTAIACLRQNDAGRCGPFPCYRKRLAAINQKRLAELSGKR
jgi:hypothetical protein